MPPATLSLAAMLQKKVLARVARIKLLSRVFWGFGLLFRMVSCAPAAPHFLPGW